MFYIFTRITPSAPWNFRAAARYESTAYHIAVYESGVLSRLGNVRNSTVVCLFDENGACVITTLGNNHH